MARLFGRRGGGLLSELKHWHGVVLQMFCSVGISEGGVEQRLRRGLQMHRRPLWWGRVVQGETVNCDTGSSVGCKK